VGDAGLLDAVISVALAASAPMRKAVVSEALPAALATADERGDRSGPLHRGGLDVRIAG
jgi:hypothetical protein